MVKVDWKDILGWDDEQLDTLRLTGYAYIRQGKYDIAHDLFRALAVVDPTSAYDLQTLGGLYLELNEPDKALEVLEAALKVEPDHLPTLLNRAKALLSMGKRQEGLAAAEKLKKYPDFRIGSVARALILAYS